MQACSVACQSLVDHAGSKPDEDDQWLPVSSRLWPGSTLHTTCHRHRNYACSVKCSSNPSCLQVYYLPDIEQGVEDLLAGLADVIFVRADLLANLQAQGLEHVSAFKVLAPVSTTMMTTDVAGAIDNACSLFS